MADDTPGCCATCKKMDITIIADLYARERDASTLQDLPGNFYEQVATLLKSINQDRDKADNYRRREYLDDQFKSIMICYESLIEIRAGKVFEQAISEAPAAGHMTPAELALYEEVQHAVQAYKNQTSKNIDEIFQEDMR